MRRCHILKLLYFIVLASVPVVARQNIDAATECPRKFWENDIETFGYEATIATLDDLALQVQQGRVQRVFLVACVHGVLPGRPYRHVAMVKNYLIGSRGLPPERVQDMFVMGCGSSSLEIWTGLTPPVFPKAVATDARYLNYPILFDEYFHAFTGEDSWIGEEDEPARLHAFAEFLTRNPEMVGYIVGFAGTPGRGYVGERLTGARFAARERAWLERNRGISKSRLRVLDGGRQIVAGIQLWIAKRNKQLPREVVRRNRPRWLQDGG
jgi:hypothetical protein